MSLGTSNRDGGKTSESGHLRAIMKSFIGEVLNGLAVAQRGAGANMSVDIAIGDAIIPRSDGTYGHPAFNDATLNQAVTTADPSNPRRDIVVMYIDYGQAPSTAVSNNTNGVVKVKVVAGTPAGSPVDPTDAAIQSSVGSGNPFIKLARLRVGAGVTSIGTSVIDDLRSIASGNISGGWVNAGSALALWAYSSFSSTTTIGVITVPSDITTKISAGMKIKVWQLTGGWKYGFVIGATATTLTVFFGLSNTLNNEAIYLPSYSMDYVPYGYNGPQLSRELYQSYTGGVVARSERWIYEISGWGAMQFTSTQPYITQAVAYGLTFASAPAPVVGAGGDSANVAIALGTGNNTINGTLVSKGYQVTTSGFMASGGSSNGTYANTNIIYYHWIAKGPVS